MPRIVIDLRLAATSPALSQQCSAPLRDHFASKGMANPTVGAVAAPLRALAASLVIDRVQVRPLM